MQYSDVVATIAIIVSFIAVPASGYLSYRYAVIGEKRKEFNAVADVIRQKLREHRRHFEQELYPSGQYIEVSQHEYDLLIDVSASGRRDSVRRRVDDYQSALSSSVELTRYGDYKITDLPRAIAALEELMPYVARR